MADIYEEIRAEREYQRERFGNTVDDTINTPWMWASYIAQYSTRWMKGTFLPLRVDIVSDFRVCMIKVASIAVAAVESLDRQQAGGKSAFYEETV